MVVKVGRRALLGACLLSLAGFVTAVQVRALTTPATVEASPTVRGALKTDEAINQTLLSNNADALAPLLADDWIVISSYGGIGKRDGFIERIHKGYFVHKTATLSDPRVRIYGNTALVTSHLSTSGTFVTEVNGKLANKCFDVHETETDVLVWQHGTWKSVLLHETKIPGPEPGVMGPSPPEIRH